jgi:hypothetical protein
MVPTNGGIKGIEELRNKVEWDFNLSLESKETLKEDDEDRFIGKMSFDIQGWLFHNHKSCKNAVLDIGTTSLVTDELEKRLDGLIEESAPLTSIHGFMYKNPRQLATSHVRILKAFITVPHGGKNFYFKIQENGYDSFNLQGSIPDYENQGKMKTRDYYITFDGYNLSKAKALFVPKDKCQIKQETIDYKNFNSKINPNIDESNPKPSKIKGIPLEVIS